MDSKSSAKDNDSDEFSADVGLHQEKAPPERGFPGLNHGEWFIRLEINKSNCSSRSFENLLILLDRRI